MDARTLGVLVDGAGRGYTVLCTISEPALLTALAAAAGATGLVIAAGSAPSAGAGWTAVRCAVEQAIPVRSHVVDAAVIVETPEMESVADEVRRVLVPGGDVRVLFRDEAGAAGALRGAAIAAISTEAGVLIARGP